MVPINYLAVLIAAVVQMILGFLWYGPLLGKEWIRLSGMSEKKIEETKSKGMGKTYVMSFVSALVMSYVLAHIVYFSGASDISMGVQSGFWVWLGFVATTMTGMVLWDGKPWKLYFINSGYYLIALMVMGAILAVWQ